MLVILNMHQHGLCTTSHGLFCIVPNAARNTGRYIFFEQAILKLFLMQDLLMKKKKLFRKIHRRENVILNLI